MKKRYKHHYVVSSRELPTVEVDTEAAAAYIRFGSGKVARTEVQDEDGVLVTFDYDCDGRVLGAELVGIEEFTLGSLVSRMHLKNPPTEARYVAAPKHLQEA